MRPRLYRPLDGVEELHLMETKVAKTQNRFRELPDGDPEVVLEKLVADLDRYLGATPPQDDFTLIALAFAP